MLHNGVKDQTYTLFIIRLIIYTLKRKDIYKTYNNIDKVALRIIYFIINVLCLNTDIVPKF